MNCDKCFYWEEYKNHNWKYVGKKFGACHRNAPNLPFIRWKEELDFKEISPLFPIMSSDEWCGEWKNKIIEKKWYENFWNYLRGIYEKIKR